MTDSQDDRSDPYAVASQMLREGRYYDESRKWYAFLYLNPLAERFYFIIVGVLSLIIFVMSLLALNGLMPLSPNVPFYYSTFDAENELPTLEGLRYSSEQSIDDALLRYYVGQYVGMREMYDPEKFVLAGRFLQRYSQASAFDEYRRLVDNSNPRSPIRRLGRVFTRDIEIQTMAFNDPLSPTQATLQFVATEASISEVRKSYWTATLRFTYSGLQISPNSGEGASAYSLPTFQVGAYEVKERIRR